MVNLVLQFPTLHTYQKILCPLKCFMYQPHLNQYKEPLIQLLVNRITPAIGVDILRHLHFLYQTDTVTAWIKYMRKIQQVSKYSSYTSFDFIFLALEIFLQPRGYLPDETELTMILTTLNDAEYQVSGIDDDSGIMWSDSDIQKIIKQISRGHYELSYSITKVYLLLPKMIFDPNEEIQKKVTESIQKALKRINTRALMLCWLKVDINTLVSFLKELDLFRKYYHQNTCDVLEDQSRRVLNSFIPYKQIVDEQIQVTLKLSKKEQNALSNFSLFDNKQDYLETILKIQTKLCFSRCSN